MRATKDRQAQSHGSDMATLQEFNVWLRGGRRAERTSLTVAKAREHLSDPMVRDLLCQAGRLFEIEAAVERLERR